MIKIRRLIIFISFFCLPITLVYISPVIIIQDSFKGIICGVIYAAIIAGGYHAVNFFGHTQNGVSLITMPRAMAYPMYYLIFTIVIVFSLILGKRSFCHYVCWIAPFVIIGTQIGCAIHLPALHMEAEKEKCIGCKKCNATCPMSLDVEHLVKMGSLTHSECILCGECKSVCPKKVFRYKFRIQHKENLQKKYMAGT